MKRIYQKPNMSVVRVQHQCMICQSVTSVSSTELGYGGASSNDAGGGEARVKDSNHDVWDDDWSK